MALLFLLNLRFAEIAVAEAKASYGWSWWKHKEKPEEGILVLDVKKSSPHLALTRRTVKLLATCARGNVRTTLDSLNWKILYGKRYKVVLTKQTAGKESERELATIIWRRTKDPQIDLDNPQIIVDIIMTTKHAYIGTRQWENTEDFESRRAHLRPEMHPSSMHPSLSRALAHLCCTNNVHDPCCGSGGVIIEASLAGLIASGADIDPEMIVRAKLNCSALGLHPELRVADATAWMPRTGAIIADLPYGKNTSPVALQPLLEGILVRAVQSTTRAVLGTPHAMVMPKTWKVRAHFEIYVHKSMTKHFYVLEKV